MTYRNEFRYDTSHLVAAPHREPEWHPTSLESEVWIPTAQAAIVAIAWSLFVALAAAAFTAWRAWPWWIVPLLALGAGGVIFAWRVTAYIADHRARLWRHEVSVGHDVDGDGVVGRPVQQGAAREDVGFVYVHNPTRARRHAPSADFRFFLREAYGTRGTTWRAWDGVKLPSGREMTRPLWEDYTTRLLRSGLATRPYATAELELSGTYRDALAVFAEVL